MTIALTAVTIRHERRIRLSFSIALASGAFSTSHYAVTNQDGLGPSPGIRAAYPVPGAPNVVDVSLAADLVDGALYLVTATSVPGVDSTTTPGPPGVSELARRSSAVISPNVERGQDDVDALVFFTDLVHDGVDYVEGPDGDLLTVTGVTNYDGALRRRLLGGPLPWDPTYSPRLDDYVDGSFGALVGARGEIERQALLDPRTDGVKATLRTDPNIADAAFYEVVAKPIGTPSLAQSGANAPAAPSSSAGVRIIVSTPTN